MGNLYNIKKKLYQLQTCINKIIKNNNIFEDNLYNFSK